MPAAERMPGDKAFVGQAGSAMLPGSGSPFDHVTDWKKDRRLIRRGLRDLEYLPRGKTAWNATLAALSFSARRAASGSAGLNLWAAMHAAPPSRRYVELAGDGLVLWHGTSAVRAEKVREHGLFSRKGVWSATDPRIAHGYTRGRSRIPGAGSAMVVLLIARSEWENRATPEHDNILRFHERVPPECVEYILWPGRVEFVGSQQARGPKPWGVARFKRVGGKWVPRSRPPVRLDAERSYETFDEWLGLSLRRILTALGSTAAIEVFSSLYATLDPWDALEHKRILEELERLCGPPKSTRAGKRFRLA